MSYKDNYYYCEIQTLLTVIDYNAETKPKPHHMNRDLMTTVLKMEVHDGRRD